MNHYIKLINYLKSNVKQRSLVIIAILISIVAAITEAASVALVIPLLESIKGEGGTIGGYPLNLISEYFRDMSIVNRIQLIAILLITLTIIKNYFIYLTGVILGKLQVSVINKVRLDCFKQLLNLNIGYLNSKKNSDIFTIIADHTRWSAQIVSQIIPLFPQLFSVILLIVMLIGISWQLTLFSIVMVLGSSFMMKNFIKKSEDTGYLSNVEYMGMNQILLSTISGIKIVKGFSKENYMLNKFRNQIAKEGEAIYNNVKAMSVVAPFYNTINIIAFGILLFFSTIIITMPDVELVESLILFLLILQRMMGPMSSINQSRANIAKTIPYIDSINNFLNKDDKPSLVNGSQNIKTIKEIKFDNLTFSYPGTDKKAISNISLEIKSGQRIAIVGPSGAGKSTITDLIFRFYDPSKGKLIVNGIDLVEYDIKTWREHISLVSQDTFLFNDSILSNIAFSNPNANIKEIESAAELSFSTEFIKNLDQGYDSIVGDMGTKLSGGQKQRLSIARAILANPSILIFDEATSALDSQSEKYVQKAIEKVSKGKTIITIAHRLSTILNYDKIYVISNGELIEEGSHDELLRNDGLYSELFKLQNTNKL